MSNCKKRKFTKYQVIGFLKNLKEELYSKKPWRDEVSYYKCDKCGCFHTSSKLLKEGNTLLQGKDYFEHQKEKWSDFLQKYSNKKGRL